jgi:hypothetical protein
LSNGPKRIISLIFDKGGSERRFFRYPFGEWAEMLGMGMLDVYSAARKLSLEFELHRSVPELWNANISTGACTAFRTTICQDLGTYDLFKRIKMSYIRGITLLSDPH